MGRKSPKLEGKDKEVFVLFKYLKQQSGMTLLELEKKFTPHPNKPLENYGGGRWSRWLNEKNLPEIGVVQDVYKYVSIQLVTGNWEEIGNESQWAQLLPALIEPKFYFLLENRSALFKILEQLEEPIVTKNMLRAIEAGYYIPNEDEIRKIFWSEKYTEGGYCEVMSKDEVEAGKMDALITNIYVRFGISEENCDALNNLANQCGLVGNEMTSWGEQIQQLIMDDSELLNDSNNRMRHLYSPELTLTSNTELTRNTAHAFFEMQDQLSKATIMFKKYVDLINTSSKSSITFGLISKLAMDYNKQNAWKNPIELRFPSVSIL